MAPSPIIRVPITKIKDGYIDVDTSATNENGDPIFSDEVYQHILAEGLKAILNSRMSGNAVGAVTKMSGAELEKAHTAARRIATENLEDLKAGKIKHSRSKSKSTIPAPVMAEARRLAKTALKDAVRAAGLKPSHYNEKAYTAKANDLIAEDPAYLKQAKENIDARKTPQFSLNLNVADLGPATPKVSKAKSSTLPVGAMPKPTVATAHRPAQH